MKRIYDACKSAGVAIPQDVEIFFAGEEPDDKGKIVDLEKSPAVTQWSDGYRTGFEVDVNLIPEDIRTLRFYCAW